MRIGIIGNMKQEVKNLKERMSNIGVKTIMGFCYYIGDINGVTVVAIDCPEGKVNMAIAASLLVSNFELDIVINYGAVIPFDKSLQYGDIVVPNQTCEWDIDSSALGYDRGYIFGLNKKILTCNEQLSNMIYEIASQENNAQYGLVITADTLILDEENKAAIQREFQTLGADLDSGSIHHVCEYARISFCSLKVVYDQINLEHYEEFTKMAVEKMDKILMKFIEKLSSENS